MGEVVSLASDCRESHGADLRGMSAVGLAGEKTFFYNHSAAAWPNARRRSEGEKVFAPSKVIVGPKAGPRLVFSRRAHPRRPPGRQERRPGSRPTSRSLGSSKAGFAILGEFMPHLPDGSFARGEKWFAKRGRPKNHTEEFWLKYEGFGCQAFEAGETGITALHKAAAFGWPQQAQFLLARNAEIVSARTSAHQSARDVAERGVAWCMAKGKTNKERQQHQEVADLCTRAENGEAITFDVIGAGAIRPSKEEPAANAGSLECRADVRFDNVPTFLMLVLVTLLNVLAETRGGCFAFAVGCSHCWFSRSHHPWTLHPYLQNRARIEALLGTHLCDTRGSILVLVLLRIDEEYERSRAMAHLLFWCCFVLSLIMPRFVVHGWLACAQCARRQDLAYISERILAMSFPAQDLEAQFRNPMAEVQRFLRSRHPKHRVYNLCKEEGRRYDDECFREVRRRITFFDHTICPLQRLVELLEEQHRFLGEDKNNVVVIHCKAGKGRTGLVCSCLLLREGIKSDACKALETYAKKRTYDGKGVTIPSQIRYVKLYSQFLQDGFLRKQVVRLKSVCLQNFMKLPGYRSSSFKET
eukprot:s848_g2.t2